MEEEIVQGEEVGDQKSFDRLIESEQEFNQMLVTQTDDYLIDLYHYLLEKEKKLVEADRDEERDLSNRVTDMINRLREMPAILDYHGDKQLTPQEQADIDQTASLVEERQKARKAGAFRQFLQGFRK